MKSVVTILSSGAFALLLAATAAVLPARAETPAGPLVTTEWLEKNIDDPTLRVVEVSVEPGLFERGHIPNAQNIVWHTDLVDTVRRDIASREDFQALVRKLGIDKDKTVILYGDNNNWFAAWGAWIFDTYGIDAKLLDGGRKKWEAEKRPLSTRAATVAASTIALPEANAAIRARLADVISVVDGKSDTALVDIRSADEYSGKLFSAPGSQELAIRAGHVPGAKNVTWSKAVAEDGTIRPVEELKKLYADAGIDGSKPIIVYCRIGERSSHTWFVLSKVLGYDVRNYDGSWTEYGNTVGLPISNPAGTVWGVK
ncbi:MAG: sulfurtransferase [Pseudochelatococcus sp.]|jgi:thiosulfate/3-mercaptopyruvate sulfurtransferase|uniref:sulfurtransferase n=1 Tax=Pseudochelatococcus sp. TaxID=2020869 RepID=UPI003D9310A5